MDKSRILYLVTLEAIGNMTEKDSSELLYEMQNSKDFLWDEMGDYQNLAALLSMVVNQEMPEKSLKENILNEIGNINKEKSPQLIDSEILKNADDSFNKKENENLESDMISEELESEISNKKTEVKIVDHLGEFEQVKSKLIKIKDVQNKSDVGPEFQVTEKEKTNKEDIERIPIIRNPKSPKSKTKLFRKNRIIAAGVVIIVIAAFGFFYLNFFNDDLEEQIQIAERETEMLISKSRVLPKEKLPIVSVENVEQNEQSEQSEHADPDKKVEIIESENSQPERLLLPKEEEIETEFVPEMIETQKEKESKKPVSPPPETPDFIEAPLIVAEEEINDKKSANLLDGTLTESKLPPTKKQIVEEPVYFIAVEEMPEPIGGIGEIQSKIIYPEIAKRAGLEGKVLVTAFVDESGNVIKAEVIKGIGLGCDEAAVNAVLQTKFKPGKQRGKSVKVKVTIPITFKL